FRSRLPLLPPGPRRGAGRDARGPQRRAAAGGRRGGGAPGGAAAPLHHPRRTRDAPRLRLRPPPPALRAQRRHHRRAGHPLRAARARAVGAADRRAPRGRQPPPRPAGSAGGERGLPGAGRAAPGPGGGGAAAGRGGARMSLPSPNLDDRTFEDLLGEAKARVAQTCPAWTDLTPHDPGVVLLEVFAYLTEVMLYRLNRLPDKVHVELLKLMGVRLYPPSAAVVTLTFAADAPLPRA